MCQIVLTALHITISLYLLNSYFDTTIVYRNTIQHLQDLQASDFIGLRVVCENPTLTSDASSGVIQEAHEQ